MSRKPVFWIAFAVLSLLCAAFSFRYFSRAFPIVTLDLRMDRAAALDHARQLASEHGWRPEGFAQAASFDLDSEVRSFAELEGGSEDAYTKLLAEGLYSPYTWRVRHFREGETSETSIRFTPSGEPYGFTEKLPEDEPGAALDADAARAIAERAAGADWGIEFGEFEPVETSQEERPGGRIDHTFVYERPDRRLGEGRYRLRLTVSGDRFTGLEHFVKVPEAFDRRYEEMRSFNDAIASGALFLAIILYLGGGCGLGLFVLMRDRWVLWKRAVACGVFISFLQTLVTINHWPLDWMSYDTALSTAAYMAQRLVSIAGQFVALTALLAVSFMAAESLTRRAFPRHIQLWRTWSRGVAGSPAVLGRTIGGYLLVAVFFAYDIALYVFANHRLGWWTPSDALADPNVLATWFPWLDSIAISLQAGFWEECLFRAVPLAGAALIGQRLGGRRWWIGGALLLQAVIFGAGHANYPTQPAYARPVELILPAIGFGLVYLFWGLLPAIVLHFTFDVTWFSLPLFVSNAPGATTGQVLVVLLALVPLWVAIAGRIRRADAGSAVADGSALNGAWAPAPVPSRPSTAAPTLTTFKPAALSSLARRVLIVLGVLGLLAWIFLTDFQRDAPPLETGRGQALETARLTLSGRGIELPDPWRELASVRADPGLEDRFVWQTGGEQAYRGLLGRYLDTPRWRVRYARFEGEVAERAEEYRVWVGPDGRVLRLRHDLAESTPGARLSEDEARSIVLSVFGGQETGPLWADLDAPHLEEISAEPANLPERTDWTFTFRDRTGYPLDQGEARIDVVVSGDRITDAYRYVHVPEEWERADRSRSSTTGALRAACGLILGLLALAGVIGAVVGWSRGQFSRAEMGIFLGIVFAIDTVTLLNGWPVFRAGFSTAQPVALQTALLLGFGLLGFASIGTAVGLVLGLTRSWIHAESERAGPARMLTGVCLGLLVAGIVAAFSVLLPSMGPSWPAFDDAGHLLPVLSAAVAPVGRFVLVTTLLLLIFAATDWLTTGWTRRRAVGSLLLPLLGFVLAGVVTVETIPSWIGAGALTGVVLLAGYLLVLRYDLAQIVPGAATLSILSASREAWDGAYPGARVGALAAVAIIGLLAVWWFRRLSTRPHPPSEEAGMAAGHGAYPSAAAE